MNKLYLIRRGNQHLGPYTVNKLREIKLDSSDSIWVQGESPAWKQLNDVNELKQLLQPNVGENKEDDKSSIDEKILLNEKSRETIDDSDKGVVYVKLPFVVSHVTTEEKKVNSGVEVAMPGIALASKAEELLKEDASISTKRRLVDHDLKEDNAKYKRSLGEIKDEYFLWLKNQKSVGNKNASKKISVVAASIAVISALAFVAWKSLDLELPTINNTSSLSYSKNYSAPLGKEITVGDMKSGPDSSRQNAEVNDRSTHVTAKAIKSKSSIINTLTEQKVFSKTPPTYADEPMVKARIPGENIIDKTNDNEVGTATADDSPPAPSPVLKVEEREVNSVPLARLVNVKGNYISSGKKGISSFDITINNSSNELLKLVAVDVLYYDARNAVINKKTVYFNNIKPASSKTLNAIPDADAMSATWQIGLINSAEGAIHYARQ